MYLWIRTQDKGLKQVTSLNIVEDEEIGVYLIKDQHKEILGVYATRKHCEKIIDEIENCLLIEEKFVFIMPKE